MRVWVQNRDLDDDDPTAAQDDVQPEDGLPDSLIGDIVDVIMDIVRQDPNPDIVSRKLDKVRVMFDMNLVKLITYGEIGDAFEYIAKLMVGQIPKGQQNCRISQTPRCGQEKEDRSRYIQCLLPRRGRYGDRHCEQQRWVTWTLHLQRQRFNHDGAACEQFRGLRDGLVRYKHPNPILNTVLQPTWIFRLVFRLVF